MTSYLFVSLSGSSSWQQIPTAQKGVLAILLFDLQHGLLQNLFPVPLLRRGKETVLFAGVGCDMGESQGEAAKGNAAANGLFIETDQVLGNYIRGISEGIKVCRAAGGRADVPGIVDAQGQGVGHQPRVGQTQTQFVSHFLGDQETFVPAVVPQQNLTGGGGDKF